MYDIQSCVSKRKERNSKKRHNSNIKQRKPISLNTFFQRYDGKATENIFGSLSEEKKIRFFCSKEEVISRTEKISNFKQIEILTKKDQKDAIGNLNYINILYILYLMPIWLLNFIFSKVITIVINSIKYINYKLNKICNNEYGKSKNTKIYLKDKGIIMISKYIKFNFIYKGNHKLDPECKLKKENMDFIDLENEIKILKFNNRIKNNIILFKSNNNNIHIISIINLFGINNEKDIFSKQIIENQIFYQNNTFKYEKLIKISFIRKYAFIDSDTNEIKIARINTRNNLSNK